MASPYQTAVVTVAGRTLKGLQITPTGDGSVKVNIILPDGNCVIIPIPTVTVINQRPIDPYPSIALTANGKIIASKECVYQNVLVEIFGACTVSVVEDSINDH
jgi:hypothetical protein